MKHLCEKHQFVLLNLNSSYDINVVVLLQAIPGTFSILFSNDKLVREEIDGNSLCLSFRPDVCWELLVIQKMNRQGDVAARAWGLL